MYNLGNTLPPTIPPLLLNTCLSHYRFYHDLSLFFYLYHAADNITGTAKASHASQLSLRPINYFSRTTFFCKLTTTTSFTDSQHQLSFSRACRMNIRLLIYTTTAIFISIALSSPTRCLQHRHVLVIHTVIKRLLSSPPRQDEVQALHKLIQLANFPLLNLPRCTIPIEDLAR